MIKKKNTNMELLVAMAWKAAKHFVSSAVTKFDTMKNNHNFSMSGGKKVTKTPKSLIKINLVAESHLQ